MLLECKPLSQAQGEGSAKRTGRLQARRYSAQSQHHAGDGQQNHGISLLQQRRRPTRPRGRGDSRPVICITGISSQRPPNNTIQVHGQQRSLIRFQAAGPSSHAGAVDAGFKVGSILSHLRCRHHVSVCISSAAARRTGGTHVARHRSCSEQRLRRQHGALFNVSQ